VREEEDERCGERKVEREREREKEKRSSLREEGEGCCREVAT
jgi:hypothetical protein